MAITNFTSSELTAYITSTEENLNLETLFGSSRYQSSIRKRVVIEEGVTVGATSTANYALNMPSGFGGRLVLVNKGSIQGAGGAAGGGTGGDAIFAGAPNILIDNRGSIYSGGGGGGTGGTGGTGGGGSYTYGYGCSYSCCINYLMIGGINYGCIQQGTCSTTCYATAYTSGGGGGSGGSGGRGRGYDGALATGLAGLSGSGGGTNAGSGGTGGTGGSGGDWGTSGESGLSGLIGANGNNGSGIAGLLGISGGLAGYYIVNNSNITWISNGTRAGRVV